MTVAELMAEARRAGIQMETKGEWLSVTAPVELLDAGWAERLRTMKPAIMPVLWRLEGMRRNPTPIPTAKPRSEAPGGPGRCFSCGDPLEAPPHAVGRCDLCWQAAELFYAAQSPTARPQPGRGDPG